MATEINVITTKDKVYATYWKTICYEASYENEEQMWDKINEAKATAFSYACDFGSVMLYSINRPDFKTSADVFEYLERNEPKNNK